MNGLTKRFGAAVEATRGLAHNTTAAVKDKFAYAVQKYGAGPGLKRSVSLSGKEADKVGANLVRSKSDPLSRKLINGKGGKTAPVPPFNPQKTSTKASPASFASGSSEEFDIPSGRPPAAAAAVRLPANERLLLSSGSSVESVESAPKPAPQQPKAQKKPLPIPPVRKTEAAAPATVQKWSRPGDAPTKGSGPDGRSSDYGSIRPDQVLTEAEKKYEIGQLKERVNELKAKHASNLEEDIDNFESMDAVKSRAKDIIGSKTQLSEAEKAELNNIVSISEAGMEKSLAGKMAGKLDDEDLKTYYEARKHIDVLQNLWNAEIAKEEPNESAINVLTTGLQNLNFKKGLLEDKAHVFPHLNDREKKTYVNILDNIKIWRGEGKKHEKDYPEETIRARLSELYEQKEELDAKANVKVAPQTKAAVLAKLDGADKPTNYVPIRPDQVLTAAEKKYEIKKLQEGMLGEILSTKPVQIDQLETLNRLIDRARAILDGKTQLSSQERKDLTQITNMTKEYISSETYQLKYKVGDLAKKTSSTDQEAIDKFEALDDLRKRAKSNIKKNLSNNTTDELKQSELEEVIDSAGKAMVAESHLPLSYIKRRVDEIVGKAASTEEEYIDKIDSLDLLRRRASDSLHDKTPKSDQDKAAIQAVIDTSERSMTAELQKILAYNKNKTSSSDPKHLRRVYHNKQPVRFRSNDGSLAPIGPERKKYIESLQLIKEMDWVENKSRELYDSTENANLKQELKKITTAAQEHIKGLGGSDELTIEKLDNTVKAAKEYVEGFKEPDEAKPASNIPAQEPFIGGFVAPGAQRPAQPMQRTVPAGVVERTDAPPAGARAWNPPGQQPHAQDARPYVFGGWNAPPPAAGHTFLPRESRAGTLSSASSTAEAEAPPFTTKEKAALGVLGVLGLATVGTGAALIVKDQADRKKKHEQENKPITEQRPGTIEWKVDPSNSPESVRTQPPSLNKDADPDLDLLNDLLKPTTPPGTGQPKSGA